MGGQVRHPAARHAQAEAQGRDPRREEDDVRQGGQDRRHEGLEDGEGLPREGPEELHLSIIGAAPLSVAAGPGGRCPTWFWHGVRRPGAWPSLSCSVYTASRAKK